MDSALLVPEGRPRDQPSDSPQPPGAVLFPPVSSTISCSLLGQTQVEGLRSTRWLGIPFRSLQPLTPGEIVMRARTTLEDTGLARFGVDRLGLGRPYEFSVAVVAVERGSDHRPVKALMPFAGLTFQRPFTVRVTLKWLRTPARET